MMWISITIILFLLQPSALTGKYSFMTDGIYIMQTNLTSRIPDDWNMFACDTSDNPILRVLWNKKDTDYISALSLEDNSIITVDLRRKSDRAAYFSGHQSYVSSLCWSPYSPYSMYSCDVKGNVHLPQYYFKV